MTAHTLRQKTKTRGREPIGTEDFTAEELAHVPTLNEKDALAFGVSYAIDPELMRRIDTGYATGESHSDVFQGDTMGMEMMSETGATHKSSHGLFIFYTSIPIV